MEATEAAAAQAGLASEDFARMRAGIGLAGLGRRGAEAALNKIAHPFASVIFISDGLAACLGAHSGADGAIVVAGTGSVGVGLIDGREIRLAGYGFPVSDEGSGADIGLQVVRLALRAADRRGELTPLLSEVLAAFDLKVKVVMIRRPELAEIPHVGSLDAAVAACRQWGGGTSP